MVMAPHASTTATTLCFFETNAEQACVNCNAEPPSQRGLEMLLAA